MQSTKHPGPEIPKVQELVAGEDTIALTPPIVVELPSVDEPPPIVGVPVHIHRETGDIEDVGVAVREKRSVTALLLCLDELGDFPELHFVMLGKLGLDLLVVVFLSEVEGLQLRSGFARLDCFRILEDALHIVPEVETRARDEELVRDEPLRGRSDREVFAKCEDR